EYYVGQQQPQDNQVDTSVTPNTQVQQVAPVKTLTGHTPEEHYQAYQAALNNGDKKSAEAILKSLELETAYQKDNPASLPEASNE
ncbi:hypothetical protein RA264_28400, partial [Pseudomonas syringae pv. tagetis]|uniref:hypothetical protein n=1 Tax=Pseudomonas syringae group genomosp. 7 TaxID=251699 RepID=UPI00376FBD9C